VEGRVVAILRPRQLVHPCTRVVTCDTTQKHCDYLIHHL
jgi:hypothetical protein